MIIKLSKANVEIKEEITWGDSQKIESAMVSGAKMQGDPTKAGEMKFDFDAGQVMLESKYVELEVFVVSIEEESGKKISFTREWMNGLSLSDGNTLHDAVKGISKKA